VEVLMGIKESIEKHLDEPDAKELFEKIYKGYEASGVDGIVEVLEEEAEKIKEEFERIKSRIEKQIGG
jgi:transcriptional/translational regulatory protein YebC/TACO1